MSLNIREIEPEYAEGNLSELDGVNPQLLDSLFSTVPGRAVFIDTHHVYRFANQEFFDFIGRPKGEVIGSHVRDILGDDVFRSYGPVLARLETGEKFHWEGWADYGPYGRRYVQEAISPYRASSSGPILGYVGIARDLTDLKLREQELADQIALQKATEAYHAAVVRSALDGIVVVDENGLVVDFNPAAEAMFGHARESVLNRSVADILIPLEHRAAHEQGMKSYLATGISRVLGKRLELPAVLADGSTIPIELSISDVTMGDRRLFAAHIRDLRSAKRAEAEIREQRNALHQKEKLAALGSLLAGVAHELNNPLSIITGQAMMLHDAMEDMVLPGRDKLIGRCDRISNAANRCARIVRSFLAIARQREAERNPTCLEEIVTEATDLLDYNMRSSGITVEVDVVDDLPDLMLDSGQIHQVLLNLLVNAQQSLEEKMGGDRRIVVRIAADEFAAQVVLSVADNGPGVPETIRGRIFDPFFTTKPQGSGTGIGLAVSRGLIEAHGGTMELSQALGGGALFTIRLPFTPAVEEKGTSLWEAAASVQRIGKAGHVLIVDDEVEIAELLAEMVDGFGYSIMTAQSGDEARARVKELDGKVDAILSDIRMPSGDGPSFYDWLQAHYPDLTSRVGFITGDTLGPAAARFLSKSGCPMLEKPFSAADIRRFLTDLVGAKL